MKKHKLRSSVFQLRSLNQNFAFLIIVLFTSSQPLHAQTNINRIIEERIESIIESTEGEVDKSEIQEQLYELAQNPINLNCKQFEILLSLQLINEYQYYQLQNYVNQLQMQSIQEIRFLEGFSEKDFEILELFIKVEECKQTGFKLYKPRQEVTSGVEFSSPKKAGFKDVKEETLAENPNKVYLGSPEKTYIRYKANSGKNLSAGFIAEKDPGEVLFKNHYKNLSDELLDDQPKGFDYLSAFASLNEIGFINKLIIGDYNLQFGQGLTMWSNLAFGKSAAATNIKKYARGILPNTSADENHFFRGIAGSFRLKNVEFNLFYSNKKRDANLVSENEFSSLQNTGYHRSINELLDKNAIKEKVYGGNINFSIQSFKLGVTAYHQSFDKRFIHDDQLYKKFNFEGEENYSLGSDFQLVLKNLDFFGEFSLLKNDSKAILGGMNVYLNSGAVFHFHYRNYSKSYYNFYATSISENTDSRNETGFYFGTEIELHPKWNLSAYVDSFKFPWLKMGVDAPSKGNEQLIQLEYKHSQNLIIYARYKRQQKEKNQDEEDIWFDYLVPETNENIRLHFNLQLSNLFEWQGRGEWHNYLLDKNKSDGFLIFQQLNYISQNNRLKCSLRYTSFNTKDYDSRIYTYEKDVRYSFSTPSFYGKGNRFYIMLTYKIKDWLITRFKIAQTRYHDREEIGSGLDLIDGNKKTDFKIQVQIKI